MEEGSGIIGVIYGVELNLTGDGAAPAAVGLGVGVGGVEADVLSGREVFESHLVVIVQL